MTEHPAEPLPSSRSGHSRMRFELISASLLIAFGLFGLPALIYLVGESLLGPYGKVNERMGTFYGDFFADLAAGSLRAWTLVLGPLILVYLIRLIFLRRPADDDSPDPGPGNRTALQQERTRTPSETRRIEPKVSLE